MVIHCNSQLVDVLPLRSSDILFVIHPCPIHVYLFIWNQFSLGLLKFLVEFNYLTLLTALRDSETFQPRDVETFFVNFLFGSML